MSQTKAELIKGLNINASAPDTALTIDSSGQIEAGSLGTASSPVYSFLTDQNTGIYSPGADQIALSTGGSGRLFIDSSGNAGLGNTLAGVAGSTTLNIGGPGTTGRLRLNYDGINIGQLYADISENVTLESLRSGGSIIFSANSAERLRITPAGRVGVGTTSPGAPLSVNGNAIIGPEAGTRLAVNLTENDKVELQVIDSTSTARALALTVGTTEAARIDSSGRVGVGITPAAQLDVKATSGTLFRCEYTGVAQLNIGNGGNSINYYDGDTQIFRSGGGTERARIDSSGRLGIGTSSPGRRLVIAGDTNTVCAVQGANNGTSSVFLGDTDDESIGALTYNHVSNHLEVKVNGAERVRVDSSGRVGIGTTVPSERLTVNDSNASAAISVRTGGAALNAVMKFNADDANYAGIGLENTALVMRCSNSSTPTERARIDSSGRLLVGTSSSRTIQGDHTPQIQVEGTNYQTSTVSIINNSNDANGAYFFLAKARGGSVGSNTVVQADDILGQIRFLGADGVGDFVQGANIQVSVDGTPGSNDMPSRLVFSTTADGASSPTERLRISADGHVSIATTSKLDANYKQSIFIDSTGGTVYRNTTSGAHYPLGFQTNTGTFVGSVSTTSTSTTYATSSDYRLKENVTAVTDGITRLQQLKPSRFNFITEPGKTVDGFLAHEAAEVVPECVTGEKDAVDDDGNPVYQGIDQSKLVPLLTAALQELVSEVESLKAEVAALKAQ